MDFTERTPKMNEKECVEGLECILSAIKRQETIPPLGQTYIQFAISKIKELQAIKDRAGVERIEKIINDNCQGVVNKDKVMLIYGHLAQAISREVIGNG